MSLEKIVLEKLQKLDLSGVAVLNVSFDSSLICVAIEIGKSVVDFKVNDQYQYQILSVTYEGVKYDNKDDLDRYNDWVTRVIIDIVPTVINEVSEYETSPQRIQQREHEVKKREEALEKRAFELAAREQLLDFQEEAFVFENQTFEDEQKLAKEQKIRTWMSENNHLVKWFGLAIAFAIILVIVFSRIGTNDDSSGTDDNVNMQGQSDTDVVEDLRENFGRPTEAPTEGSDHVDTAHTVSEVDGLVVGEDLAAGRYVITSVGSGHLIINSGSEQIINEMVGSDGGGVPSVTVSLEAGDIVTMRDAEDVVFTPTTSQLLTTLTTGIWLVGVDIEAGTFYATTENSTGNLVVRSPLGRLQANAVISSQEDGRSAETARVVLEDGDVIAVINGLTHVDFEWQDPDL